MTQQDGEGTSRPYEVGHALVALFIPRRRPDTENLHHPRGIARGLYPSTPDGDRFLMDKTELENKIAVLLGGRNAEE